MRKFGAQGANGTRIQSCFGFVGALGPTPEALIEPYCILQGRPAKCVWPSFQQI